MGQVVFGSGVIRTWQDVIGRLMDPIVSRQEEEQFRVSLIHS